MNLNRIAPAHGEMRLGVALEKIEFAPATRTAIRAALRPNRLEASAPDVARNQAVVLRLKFPKEQFQGCGSLQRSDYPGDGAEHADSVTRRLICQTGFFGIPRFSQAREASRLP